MNEFDIIVDTLPKDSEAAGSVEGDGGQQGHPGGFPFDMGGMGGMM